MKKIIKLKKIHKNTCNLKDIFEDFWYFNEL